MFSQRKSFFKGKLFYVLLIGLFAFGVWINNGQVDLKNPEGVSTNSKQTVDNLDKNKKTDAKEKDILENIVSNGNTNTTKDAIGNSNSEEDTIDAETAERQNKEYYLIKEIDGQIKVFHYDSNGNERLFRTSDIEFTFLSKEDQLLFKKGIIKNSQEELDELLQDFES